MYFGSSNLTVNPTPTITPTPTTPDPNIPCSTGSLVFGANEKYISYAGDNDWALGTGDFCIEWWQYQTAASPPMYSRLFQVGDYPNHSIAVSIESGNFILWVNNGSAANGLYSNYTLSNYLNQWVHFAVVRQSGTSSVYQNGTRIINVSTPNDVTNSTDPLKIGFGSSNWWNGKITNFRWVKGSSVYDGTQTTITVPTEPLPVVVGTKLLLLAYTTGTYLADSSGLSKSATNNGGVTWSSDSPNFICQTPTPTPTPTATPTPNLVTSGLLIQLDAYEVDSFPNSGTTVYDLVNNYDHTLIGATFTNLNGVKCFDCTTGNNRVAVNGTGPTLPTNGYTYITWTRMINNNSGFRTLLYTSAPRYTPITVPNGESTLGYWDTEFRSSGYDISLFQEVWTQFAVVGDNVSQTFYINGSQVGSTIAQGSGGNVHWGWGNNNTTGQPWGHVANLYLYNRKLSLYEIQQQYNFLSPRFIEITATPTPTPTPTLT